MSKNSIVEIKLEENIPRHKYILHLSGSNEKHVTQLYELLLTDFEKIQNSAYRLVITQNFFKTGEGDLQRTVETDVLPNGYIHLIYGIRQPQSNIQKFIKLIRDYLFYGRLNNLIEFTTLWNKEDDNIIKVKICDPLTKEDIEKIDKIINMLDDSKSESVEN